MINKILMKADTRRGAPMGRPNIGGWSDTPIDSDGKAVKRKIYQKEVRLYGGYDRGGAYWGYGTPLYVHYTRDGKFIQFKRLEK